MWFKGDQLLQHIAHGFGRQDRLARSPVLDSKIGLEGRHKMFMDGLIGLKSCQTVVLDGKIGLKSRQKVDLVFRGPDRSYAGRQVATPPKVPKLGRQFMVLEG